MAQTTDNYNYSVRKSKPQLSKYTLTIMHYSVKVGRPMSSNICVTLSYLLYPKKTTSCI